MVELASVSSSEDSLKSGENSSEKKVQRKAIPGNLPYTSSYGTVEKILEKLRAAQTPPKFTTDFLSSVLGFSGGSARSVIPIMKRVKLLSSDGTPSDLYASYKTDSGRPKACLQILRNGFGSIFQKNEYAHKLDDRKLTDIVREITGLPDKDGVLRAIIGTFKVFSKDAGDDLLFADLSDADSADESPILRPLNPNSDNRETASGRSIGLAYNINIQLPETRDISVYNAIFKSIRDNLL